jgi:hypothetical protein
VKHRVTSSKMATVKTPSRVLEELKIVLADYPMDCGQRASVVENAAKMPEKEVRAMVQKMKATASALATKVRELNELMSSSEVVVIHETTAATAYQAAVPTYA